MTGLWTIDFSAGTYALATVVGFAVGAYGHVIKSTPVILLGIAILLVISSYVWLATTG